jgi:hypothetical protein
MIEVSTIISWIITIMIIIQCFLLGFNRRRMRSQLKVMKDVENDIEVFRSALLLAEKMRECYRTSPNHSHIKYRLAIYEQVLERAENHSKKG